MSHDSLMLTKCLLPNAATLTFRFSPAHCNGSRVTRCERHRQELSACPVPQSTRQQLHRAHHRQRDLVAALAGQRVAIVGDSMARQAFFALVARLRGSKHVVDLNTWRPMAYSQAVVHNSPSGAEGGADKWWLIDAFEVMPGTRSAREALAAKHFDKSSSTSKLRPRHQPEDKTHKVVNATRIDFFFAPCWHNLKREAVKLLGVQNYSNVVLFWPAYWHLNGGSCGSGGIFNTSHINVVGKWIHWRKRSAAHHSQERYTLVSAPEYAIRPGRSGRHEQLAALNVALRERFAAGAFPSNWELADFARLSERLRPPTITPFGKGLERKENLHQVCQFAKKLEAYMSASNISLLIYAKVEGGDCDDTGNTALWKSIFLSQQQHRSRLVAHPTPLSRSL